MESEQRIGQAIEVIHRFQGLYGKRGKRIHIQAAVENNARIAALEGLCGQCRNLKLRFGFKDGKEIAALICKKNYSPLELYENVPFERPTSCPGFNPKSEISPKGVKS